MAVLFGLIIGLIIVFGVAAVVVRPKRNKDEE